MRPAFFVLVVAACAFILAPSVSRAVTVEVFPGNGTLQAAITAAPEGARLTLHPGVYNGAVVVPKRLTIECLHTASNDGGCLIDAQCAAAIAFDVAADKVNLKMSKKKILGATGGPLVIARGTSTGIHIAGRNIVKLSRVQVLNAYMGLPCGTEQEGIAISGTSYGIKVDESYFPAEALAGIHVSGLGLGSKLQIKRMQTSVGPNQTGLLIENSGAGALLGKSGISLAQSLIPMAGPNATGVRLINTDGVKFLKNTTTREPAPRIRLRRLFLDANSDRNLLLKNTWLDPEADETPYADSGTGNCGQGNNFPVPPCP
jgi:hypothetical protein